VRVKFIPVDLEKPMEFREITKGNKLNEVYELLGGDCYAEQVRLGRYPDTYWFGHDQSQTVPPDGSLYMIVDEDGIRKRKPANIRASALYGTQYHGQPIVGDAILCGIEMTEDGPDWGDYPLED
jgi:hypothetical protein